MPLFDKDIFDGNIFDTGETVRVKGMVARDPARVGECEVSFFRVGVYTSRWERLFQASGAYRELTLRKYNRASRDSATGVRYGKYVPWPIHGILTHKGGSLPSFASGVSVQLDALLLTLDPVGLDVKDAGNQVYDQRDNLLYRVSSILKNENTGPEGGFGFYTVQLRLDPLENTGGL